MATEFSQSRAPSVHTRLMGELEDPRVRGAVSRVNGARVDRLAATYRDLGVGKRQAGHRARIAYATCVGLLQMAHESPKSRMKPAEREDFFSELRSRLIDGS